MDKNFFNDIEKKTGVNMNEIMNLAHSLQSANLKDEQTVRKVIAQVSQIAGKPVPKEKEDRIVESIMKNNMPMDLSQITNMINKK